MFGKLNQPKPRTAVYMNELRRSCVYVIWSFDFQRSQVDKRSSLSRAFFFFRPKVCHRPLTVYHSKQKTGRESLLCYAIAAVRVGKGFLGGFMHSHAAIISSVFTSSAHVSPLFAFRSSSLRGSPGTCCPPQREATAHQNRFRSRPRPFLAVSRVADKSHSWACEAST